MLELAFADGDPLDQAVDLLVIGCRERDLEGQGIVGRADARLDGLLRRAAVEERFAAKPGQSLLAHTHGALPARRVALVGLGALAGDDPRALRSAAGSAVRIAERRRGRARCADLAVGQPPTQRWPPPPRVPGSAPTASIATSPTIATALRRWRR